MSRRREDARQLAERAAEWLTVLKTAGPAERAEFADWLTISPRHAEEFLLVTALMSELERMPLEKLPGVQERLATTVTNMIPLPSRQNAALAVTSAQPAENHRAKASGMRWLAAASIAIVCLGAMLAWWWVSNRPTVYATTIGEQRTIKLRDGSTMDLNTQSLVQVRFSRHTREVRLIEGEALFAVQHDPTRPFTVATDMAVVQAIGTRFDVYRQDRAITVSVVEGRVDVAAANPNGTDTAAAGSRAAPSTRSEPDTHDSRAVPLHLSAGELVNIESDGRMDKRADPGGVNRAVAWREHRLMFLSETLANVAKEFNRYNQVPRIVVLGDAAQLRYSGVFDSNDPQSLLEFLREDAGLSVSSNGDDLVIKPHPQTAP